MRRFEIIDGARRNAMPCAILNWENNSSNKDSNTEEETLSIDINENACVNDVPMLFAPFVREGKCHIGEKWAKRWIEERVVPSSRQNLGEVLRANNLEFYDAMALFIAGSGKCEQDDFFIREIKSKNENNKQSLAQRAGQAIKNARNDVGMTQHELAQAAKINQSALSNLENGHGNPTIGLLEDVANALEKTIDIRIV